MDGAREGLFSPTNANGLGPAAAAAAATPSRPRASLSSKLSMAPEDAFAREPTCGVCVKSFNILRRRHHCRSCHIAVCKDCGRKAIDRKRPERTRPQWYCMSCLDEDASLEVTGSRPTASKRRSFSSASPFAPTAPQVTSLLSPVIDENSGSPTEPTDGSEEDTAVDQQDGEEEPPVAQQEETSLFEENGDLAAKTKAKEYEELVARLQAENDKLRQRVEKFKRKMSDAERRRQEREEEHARAVSEASTAAAAAATAAAEAQVNSHGTDEPAPVPQAAAAVPVSNGTGVAAKDHPDYLKFFKLLSMGLPAEQVKLKMQASGMDPAILDDPDAIIGGAAPSSSDTVTPPASGSLVKDDEQYAKFFKLLKMGMPAEQIKLKMSAGGLNPDLLDTPDAPMPGSGGGSAPAGSSSQVTTVKEDPAYEKFFKLVKMGMPPEQVKMKMSAAGLNGDLLDTPDAPSPNQKSGGGGGGSLLAGLPPPTAAVKVDPSALKASLASQLSKKSAPKKPEEPLLPKKETITPNVELRP
ncbi:hypothetical protein BBJ28_00014507, partial [Nothophytophthora sp. Chile5]